MRRLKSACTIGTADTPKRVRDVRRRLL